MAVGPSKLLLVTYLLNHGANPNANRRGEINSVLETAAISASPKIVWLLLKHGAEFVIGVPFTKQPATVDFKSVVFLLMQGMILMLFRITKTSSRIPPSRMIGGHRFMGPREMIILCAFISCWRGLRDMTSGIQMT